MKAIRVPLTAPLLTGSEKTGSFKKQCHAGPSGDEGGFAPSIGVTLSPIYSSSETAIS
jgi:hypothetical protein